MSFPREDRGGSTLHPFMPKKPNFILEVTIRQSEAYTLDTVARSPRMFKPKDVLTACDNLVIEVKTGDPPHFIPEFVHWVFRDFFALAHRTGLYNRQSNLWEALSKVTKVEVAQQTVGFFKREPVPVYELVFQNSRQNPVAYALFVAGDLKPGEKSDFVGVFKNFLNDSKKLTSLTGMFACFALDVFPEDVLKFFKKNTESEHPVGRYEATITGYSGPVNLVDCRLSRTEVEIPLSDNGEVEAVDAVILDSSVDHADTPEHVGNASTTVASDKSEFELIYPDLARKSRD